MKYIISTLVICLILLAGCSAAEISERPVSETTTADTETPAVADQFEANPTGPVIPATLVPQASATLALWATAGVATPIVITAVAGPTSLPLNQITPAATPTWAPPTPIPTLSDGMGPTTLKYLLLEQFPGHFYCDPDEYPVARGDEAQLAVDRLPQIQASQEEFRAILTYLGLLGQDNFSNEEKLAIYRQHKALAAMTFQMVGNSYRFRFQILDTGSQGYTLTGRVDGQGTVTGLERSAGVLSCPICLAAGTLIDTPFGSIAVELLQPGDLVWTVDAYGARVAAPIVRTGRTVVPSTHRVVHLTLDDGRELWASAGHRTAEGRSLDELQVGALLDGGRIVSVQLETYDSRATYDILPAGVTGFYWAGKSSGILLASTLAD